MPLGRVTKTILSGAALQLILGVSLFQADPADRPVHRTHAPYLASWALVAAGCLLQVDRIAGILASF